MLRRLALLLPLFAVACATGMTRSIDEVMKEYDGAVPGASVLVLRDGRPVFERSYGLADVENGIAATPATHYRLASVTKQFTAAAILTLEAEGKLSLDESVRRQLPTLPSWAEPVTIRHLLTHTSGLVDYEDVIPPGTTRQLTDADVLHLLEQQPALDFPAGSRYRYSNSGYALLALIVEQASATSFATYLHDAIFAPRGMATAVAHVEGVSIVPSRAFGTSRDGDHWKRTDQSLTSAVLGDGGIYASVDDLASWLRALEGGDFERTMTPQVETDKPEIRYGFGWRISSHDGRRMVWHTGETIGFRNALIRFPDERLAVVVLTNRNEGDPLQRALLIADLLH